MTTVGHSLTGLSIAALTLPKGKSLLYYLLVGHFFVFFANMWSIPSVTMLFKQSNRTLDPNARHAAVTIGLVTSQRLN